jgi:hypothetical protein
VAVAVVVAVVVAVLVAVAVTSKACCGANAERLIMRYSAKIGELLRIYAISLHLCLLDKWAGFSMVPARARASARNEMQNAAGSQVVASQLVGCGDHPPGSGLRASDAGSNLH